MASTQKWRVSNVIWSLEVQGEILALIFHTLKEKWQKSVLLWKLPWSLAWFFLQTCKIGRIFFLFVWSTKLPFFLSRKTQMEFQYIYVVIIFRQQEIHFPYVMWITLKDIGKTEIHLGNKDPWRSENFQLQCLGTVLFSKFISRHYIVTWYFSNISFLLSSLFLFSFYIRWRLLRLTLYLWTNQKRKMEFFYNNPGFLELILSPQNFNGKKKQNRHIYLISIK